MALDQDEIYIVKRCCRSRNREEKIGFKHLVNLIQAQQVKQMAMHRKRLESSNVSVGRTSYVVLGSDPIDQVQKVLVFGEKLISLGFEVTHGLHTSAGKRPAALDAIGMMA
jgi:hypothetical protein